MAFEWRFGIEEEYFLVDCATGDACAAPPDEFWTVLKTSAPGATKELLQSQVEARTPPCSNAGESLEALLAARAAIAETATQFGLGMMASGTHPDFDWRGSSPSSGLRYSNLVRDMRMLALRNMFCGLHVHVETPPGQSRVALMTRCARYLPLFLALSVSSPFWRGEWTGMRGYRLTGYDELPRTGLPPFMKDDAEFERYADALMSAGAIRDPTYIWWAIRPSHRFPTLEPRVCDSVTDVRAAVAVAVLFRSFLHRLARDPKFGAAPSPVLRAIAEENRWQVQCDGLGATVVDVETLKPTGVRDAIDRLALALADDARALGCDPDFGGVRSILAEGTSADRQIDLWSREAEKRSPSEGIGAVKAWLVQATMA